MVHARGLWLRAMADVEVTRDGRVLTITLNRPDVLNALTARCTRGSSTRSSARGPAVRAVVITGAGRGFCVGQDLQEFAARRRRRRPEPARQLPPQRACDPRAREAGDRRGQRRRRRRGHVARARLRRAHRRRRRRASCRRSSRSASSPTRAAPGSCAALLGAARAFEWLTTGRRLGADEARDWGLVSEVVADERAAPSAWTRWPQLFAAMPTRAVWQTKRLLDAAESDDVRGAARARGDDAGRADADTRLRRGRRRRSSRSATPPFTGADAPWPHPVRLVVTTTCGAGGSRSRCAGCSRCRTCSCSALDVRRVPGRARQLGHHARPRPPPAGLTRGSRGSSATRRTSTPTCTSSPTRTRRSAAGRGPIRSTSRSPRRRRRRAGRRCSASCS